MDIRRFFQGLQIPDGGVHIVGGENGDAFIAFASDEDARQAMERNGHSLKDSRIKLLLSSRNEMQRVIDLARNQTLGLKPLDAMTSVSANYLSPNLMPLPNASQNALKANIISNRTNSRSPDRRAIDRTMDSRLRPRSRSRSPLRTERERSLNGSSGSGLNSLDRLGSMHSGIMNTLREPPTHNSYPPNEASIRSRLSYDAVIPSNGLEEGRRQWTQNESFEINSSSDFSRELDIFRENRSLQRDTNIDRSYTVELRNLPFNICVRDIIEFFNGLYVPEENVKILIDDRGLTTGGALVRFHNEREFDAALSMNKRFLGDRKIDVQPLLDNFPAERNEQMPYSGQPLQHSLDINPNVIESRPVERDLVLYMKGLPFSNCTERDVAKFFEPIRLADIVIEMDPKGKPAGNAFVEFENINDYDLGMERNLRHMGRRYIELLPTTKEDMLDARRGGPPPINDQMKTFCVNITGLPATITNRDLTKYFSNAGAQPYAIHIMLRPDGLNAGEAYVEFGTPESQYCALRLDGEFWLNSRLTIKAVPFEMMREVVGRPPPIEPSMSSIPPASRSTRGGRHEDRMRPQHRREREQRRQRSGGDPFADNRCILLAANIPYKSSIEDVCVFFSDFGITEQCIRRRFNDKGQPTADAQIAFHSPEDASRALRQMHKKFLLGRPVFLSHI